MRVNVWYVLVLFVVVGATLIEDYATRGNAKGTTLGQLMFFQMLAFFGICDTIKRAGDRIAAAIAEARAPTPPPLPTPREKPKTAREA